MTACVQKVYENASSSPAAAAGEGRARDPRRHAGEQPDGGRCPDGGEEVQSTCRIAGAEQRGRTARRVRNRAGRRGGRSSPARARPPGSRRCRRGRRRGAASGCTRQKASVATRQAAMTRARARLAAGVSGTARLRATNSRTASTPRALSTCARLDPAAPRRAEPEAHLPGERVSAVAVAVDGHGHAGGDGTARQRGRPCRDGRARRRSPSPCRLSAAAANSTVVSPAS